MDPILAGRYRKALTEIERFRGSLKSASQWQAALLRDLIQENAQTSFGKQHSFHSIRTWSEFKRAVPIRDYAEISPWINRAAAGEQNVLTADDPVVFFKTSGSTGDNKVIPITSTFAKRVYFPFFYAATGNLFEHFPILAARDDNTLNMRQIASGEISVTPSGRPHLGASQIDLGKTFGEAAAAEPGSRAPWTTLSFDKNWNELAKAYARVRQAIEYNIECIVGINPAIVAALPHQLSQWLPDIIKDLFDGTTAGVNSGPPNKQRSAELERIARLYQKVLPSHVWPNIKVIYCWTGGVASLYVGRLKESFGSGVTVLPAPIAASEGPIGLAVDRHASAGALMIDSVVCEFLDAEQDIRPDSETVDYSDLVLGHEYHVIISHIGGLYRYAVGDVVRVVDTLCGVPRVEYVGRKTVSDFAGERLREFHVIRALRSALACTGIELSNASCTVLSASDIRKKPHYAFLIAPQTSISESEVKRLEVVLDQALSDSSDGYRRVRTAGKLEALQLKLAAPDVFFREWRWRVSNGLRAAQAKDRLFVSRETWDRLIANDFPEISPFDGMRPTKERML
jgi:hypothetical protein